MRSHNGTLLIIGGHEDREGERKILGHLARRVGRGKICIATIASSNAAEELWKQYAKAFRKLGVSRIAHLDIARRGETADARALEMLADANCVFFTGGDQLKITSEIGGTPIEARIREIYRSGGIIAGTSAGASVMSETMLVSGAGVQSYRIGGGLRMAPGLGFLKDVLIDQHFTERGRIGRLLGALAHNPKYVGIGLDENTAIIVREKELRVIGYGGVYIVDAHAATDSNISDGDRDTSLSLFNVKIHLLSAGDRYDFTTRKPELLPARSVEFKTPRRSRKRVRKTTRPRKGRKTLRRGKPRLKANDSSLPSPHA